jgi:glycosyltransferase involved in cell wall biosynthesis
LRIVGQCHDPTPYRELAGNCPTILIERPVMHGEAMQLMAGCTMFVLPSRLEGVPRVVVEAMAMGKPVVASKINGTPYILEHGREGLLFESEDVEGLAECMDQLLTDKQLAQTLGEHARERILRDHSTGIFASRFRDMIAEVVGRRSRE